MRSTLTLLGGFVSELEMQPRAVGEHGLEARTANGLGWWLGVLHPAAICSSRGHDSPSPAKKTHNFIFWRLKREETSHQPHGAGRHWCHVVSSSLHCKEEEIQPLETPQTCSCCPRVGTSVVADQEEPPCSVRPRCGRSSIAQCLDFLLPRTLGSTWADLVCLEMPKTCCGEGTRRIFPCCCLHPELFFHLSCSAGVYMRRVTMGQLPPSHWGAGGLPEPVLPKA